MKVVTTNGTLVKAKVGPANEGRPLTEQEAKAIAKQGNAEAETMGLEVRYEVKGDDDA